MAIASQKWISIAELDSLLENMEKRGSVWSVLSTTHAVLQGRMAENKIEYIETAPAHSGATPEFLVHEEDAVAVLQHFAPVVLKNYMEESEMPQTTALAIETLSKLKDRAPEVTASDVDIQEQESGADSYIFVSDLARGLYKAVTEYAGTDVDTTRILFLRDLYSDLMTGVLPVYGLEDNDKPLEDSELVKITDVEEFCQNRGYEGIGMHMEGKPSKMFIEFFSQCMESVERHELASDAVCPMNDAVMIPMEGFFQALDATVVEDICKTYIYKTLETDSLIEHEDEEILDQLQELEVEMKRQGFEGAPRDGWEKNMMSTASFYTALLHQHCAAIRTAVKQAAAEGDLPVQAREEDGVEVAYVPVKILRILAVNVKKPAALDPFNKLIECAIENAGYAVKNAGGIDVPAVTDIPRSRISAPSQGM